MIESKIIRIKYWCRIKQFTCICSPPSLEDCLDIPNLAWQLSGGVIHPAGCSELWNLRNRSPWGARGLGPGFPACPASSPATLLIVWRGLKESGEDLSWLLLPGTFRPWGNSNWQYPGPVSVFLSLKWVKNPTFYGAIVRIRVSLEIPCS